MFGSREVYSVEVLYDENKGTITERWLREGQLSRDWGPAVVTTHLKSGIVIAESWYKDGIHGRADGPAQINRDAITGVAVVELWKQSFTERHHREGGPAVVIRDPSTGAVTRATWYNEGQRVDVSSKTRHIYRHAQIPKP